MPTPSEQKALAFLAFVILLGGAVRIVRAGAPRPPSAGEQQALARQAIAVESAGARQREQKGRKGAKVTRYRRKAGADTVAGVVGVPPSDVRPGSPLHDDSEREGWVNGFPPPSPRIDSDNRRDTPSPGSGAHGVTDGRVTQLDVDVATAAELEALPGVGPTMARRLVANRDSLGPFGSLEGLRRVKGMGPAGIRRLAGRVTFSGRAASLSPRSRYY